MKPSARNGRRLAAAIGTAVVLLATIGAFGASSAPLSSGSVGGFEDDGNLVTNGSSPAIDWDSVDTSKPSFAKVVDDLSDSGYVGSSKENEPENFACNTGGANPGKNNILRAYVNTRITGPLDANPTTAFLDLAFVRASGTGDAHVNFEFNRNEITNPCPYTGRAVGDLLLAFDYPGGGGVANIQAFQWDGSNWIEFALPTGAAAGTTNSGTVTDSISGGSVLARRFGEASVDLVAFQNATGKKLLDCPGFGHVNIRSRSSGESFNAALQDRLPQQGINLSTCGSVSVKKVDQDNNPLPGAVFGLFDNQAGTGDPVYTCTSGADGVCKITNVTADTYWLKEVSAPAGYGIDDTTTHEVTVADFQNVDLTKDSEDWFTDTQQQGFVHVTKVVHDSDGKTMDVDDSMLVGTSFQLYDDKNNNGQLDPNEEVTLTTQDPATCEITTGDGCDIGPVAPGDYRVAETAAPTGMSSDGDVDVTVPEGNDTVDVDYVNVAADPAIGINKDGPELAHVGDTVTYSFEVTNSGPLDLTSVALTDAKCDSGTITLDHNGDGDDVLSPDETWNYSCTHVVKDTDADPLPNTASVAAVDIFGRGVGAHDSHSVDIIHPAITIDKTVNPTSGDPGQVVTYSYKVTNTGDC